MSRWLVATQRADGTWDEPHFTGTGFPGDFYINYHLYRLVFPISALGRYVRAVSGMEELCPMEGQCPMKAQRPIRGATPYGRALP